MSLIDTLVGLAIFVLVFSALFAGAQLAVGVIANNKAKTGALALLNERLELIKSIPYDTLGTVGGIPSGTIDQTATTTLNATKYSIRTLIQYVDQPQDGLGVADTNGITADSKQTKVEATWTDRGMPRVLSLVTTLAPKGIESVAGGGTLRINVFNSHAQAVPGASVRVENTTLVPPVDVTTFTSSQGVVLFPGADAGSSYKVTVTKSGYSTDKTYDSDAGNPNPSPGHFTIGAGQTTTGSFSIDTVGAIVVRTFLPVQPASFIDTFTDAGKIVTLSNTQVSGGAVLLAPNGNDYVLSGSALSTTTSPQLLYRWDLASWNHSTPENTSSMYQVMQVDPLGNATLIPDIVLPGNSAGFTISPISLTSIATSTYPRLALLGNLSTTDASTTPSLLDWTLDYSTGPTPLPNIPFSIRGSKIIGTTAGGAPIYKYSSTGNSGSSGMHTFPGMEWDLYQITEDPTVTTYDVMESCAPQPVSLAPGGVVYSDLTLVPKTTNSLLMAFRNAAGTLLSGVSVVLTRPGFSANATSTPCGQIFFSGITAATYTVEASLSGYTAASTTIDVSGPAVSSLTLSPL